MLNLQFFYIEGTYILIQYYIEVDVQLRVDFVSQKTLIFNKNPINQQKNL